MKGLLLLLLLPACGPLDSWDPPKLQNVAVGGCGRYGLTVPMGPDNTGQLYCQADTYWGRNASDVFLGITGPQ